MSKKSEDVKVVKGMTIPEGWMIDRVKVYRDTKHTIEKIICWESLKVLNEADILPKGYFTKVTKGSIKFQTAMKYIMSSFRNKGLPFNLIATKHKKDVYVALVLKVN